MIPPGSDPDSWIERVSGEFASEPYGLFTRAREVLSLVAGKPLILESVPVDVDEAQKQLEYVYRSELAYLLRVVFLHLYEKQPHHRSARYFELPSLEAMSERLKVITEFADDSEDVRAGMDWLHVGISAELNSQDVDARELLLASLRLEDSPNTRQYLVCHLRVLGELQSAEQIARELADRPMASSERRSVYETRGVLALEQGDFDAASRYYRQASRIAHRNGHGDAEQAAPLLNLLYCELQRGNTAGALEAAQRLRSLVSPWDPVVSHFTRVVPAVDGMLSSTGQAALGRIRCGLGAIGDRFQHALMPTQPIQGSPRHMVAGPHPRAVRK